jgi:perosamine synthetase
MTPLKKSENMLQRLRSILTDLTATYALHEPDFSGHERKYVDDCIASGWVSSVGEYVNRFEKQLAEFTGMKHAIATVNGTAALHACLLMAGVEADQEVLLPTLTFVATANAVRYCAAIPHFIDADPKTFGIDVTKLENYLNDIAVVKSGACFNKKTGRKISALCITHVFGHLADLDRIKALCDKFSIRLIEDAAEALGSYYKNQPVGHASSLAALSFNGNKIITTGGGGAVLTNDDELAKRIKHLTTTAKAQHQWQFCHDEVGYNYRMPNLNAALGCAQLERLPEYISAKRALTLNYQTLFSNCAFGSIFREPENTQSNYWLNVFMLDDADMSLRDEILQFLTDHKIHCRPVWELMHRLPMYQDMPAMDLSQAEKLQARVILLPSGISIAQRLSRKQGQTLHA